MSSRRLADHRASCRDVRTSTFPGLAAWSSRAGPSSRRHEKQVAHAAARIVRRIVGIDARVRPQPRLARSVGSGGRWVAGLAAVRAAPGSAMRDGRRSAVLCFVAVVLGASRRKSRDGDGSQYVNRCAHWVASPVAPMAGVTGRSGPVLRAAEAPLCHFFPRSASVMQHRPTLRCVRTKEKSDADCQTPAAGDDAHRRGRRDLRGVPTGRWPGDPDGGADVA